jgi:hypothetical protein
MYITNNGPVGIRHGSSAIESIIAEVLMGPGGDGQFNKRSTSHNPYKRMGIDIMLTIGILDTIPKSPSNKQNA